MRNPILLPLLVSSLFTASCISEAPSYESPDAQPQGEDVATLNDVTQASDVLLPRPDVSSNDVIAPTDAGLPDARVLADVVRSDVNTADSGEADVALADVALADVASPDVAPLGPPGCRAQTPPRTGELSFTSEGLDRRYFVYLPQNYNQDQSWPLVFALHGNGGSADYWNVTEGERDIRGALENDAILVVAEAIGGNWRDYSDEENWASRIEMELRYFDTILEDLKSEACVDEAQIFAMGFSGGGSFAGLLGCRRDYINAFASGGAVLYFDPAECTHVPSAWVSISEGDDGNGRRAFLNHFVTSAQCTNDTETSDPQSCEDYAGCAAGKKVEFCSYPGGHAWAPFGTDAAWRFFQAAGEP